MLIPVTCKHCGLENIKATSHPKTLSDLRDTICSNCRAKISINEITLAKHKLLGENIRERIRNTIRKPRRKYPKKLI